MTIAPDSLLPSGFYTDVPHHPPGAGSQELRAQRPTDDARLMGIVAGYLRGGRSISESPGRGRDILGERRDLSLTVRTDGRWVWPDDAAFYCGTYGIMPGSGLVEKALALSGTCPEVGEREAVEIGHRFFAD